MIITRSHNPLVVIWPSLEIPTMRSVDRQIVFLPKVPPNLIIFVPHANKYLISSFWQCFGNRLILNSTITWGPRLISSHIAGREITRSLGDSLPFQIQAIPIKVVIIISYWKLWRPAYVFKEFQFIFHGNNSSWQTLKITPSTPLPLYANNSIDAIYGTIVQISDSIRQHLMITDHDNFMGCFDSRTC